MQDNKIILLGGGGHCHSCIDVIEQENRFKIIGILDNTLYQQNIQNILGYPLLGGDDLLPTLTNQAHNVLITVGQIHSPQIRKNLYYMVKSLGFQLPTIISPLAYIARNTQINEGSIIMHHAVINTNSKIGKMCIINTKALIEHDCIVEDFCHISTGAILNGNCSIQKESFIGTNTALKHNTSINQKQIIYSRGGGLT